MENGDVGLQGQNTIILSVILRGLFSIWHGINHLTFPEVF